MNYYGVREDGELHEVALDYHICTDEDFAQMSPPTTDALTTLNHIKESEQRNLYCFDWDKLGDELGVWGVADFTAYRYIEMILTPCNMLGWGRTEV